MLKLCSNMRNKGNTEETVTSLKLALKLSCKAKHMTLALELSCKAKYSYKTLDTILEATSYSQEQLWLSWLEQHQKHEQGNRFPG